jgi:hypothetical protein
LLLQNKILAIALSYSGVPKVQLHPASFVPNVSVDQIDVATASQAHRRLASSRVAVLAHYDPDTDCSSPELSG